MPQSDASLVVGIWQDGGILGDIDANLQTIRQAARRATENEVDFLIFPECYLTGYFNRKDVGLIASKVDGDSVAKVAEIAENHSIAMLVGTYEKQGDEVFNSAVFVDASGLVRATYRKRMLYGDWEKIAFKRGHESVILEYNGINIAILICFDVEFPELVRDCAQHGADMVAVPTSLMAPHERIAQHVIPTRAIENQIYVAYANRIGREDSLQYVGQSSICDPLGNLLADGSKEGVELLIARISKSEVEAVRRDFSYLEEIRTG